MYSECTRNFSTCEDCPDFFDCPYEKAEKKNKKLTEEINQEINEEKGKEIE